MKRLLALMLALAMVFALAACKDKPDDSTTDTSAAGDVPADADGNTDAAEPNEADSTEAATDENGSEVAPSQDASEAASENKDNNTPTAGTQNNAAAIKAPVNGSKTEIVKFFNQYATAMKQYKGKVTVKRVAGTTSKINSLNPNKLLGVDLVAKAEPLLPNDYPKTETKTFNGGKASDGTTLASFMPANKLTAYNVDPNGVKSASCTKQGSGWKVSITLVTESGEGMTYKPKYHGSCFDTLSLTNEDFKPFTPESTKVNYQSGTFTFVLNADGTISSITVREPANVVCKLKLGGAIDADFTGTWKQDYTFTY